MSDNQFTDQMNLAKKQLFKQINEQKKAWFLGAELKSLFRLIW